MANPPRDATDAGSPLARFGDEAAEPARVPAGGAMSDREAAEFARQNGLHLHAGHGLNYQNVGPVARLNRMAELNIGHSIVSRAVLVGMERAVREMKEAIREGGERHPR